MQSKLARQTPNIEQCVTVQSTEQSAREGSRKPTHVERAKDECDETGHSLNV